MKKLFALVLMLLFVAGIQGCISVQSWQRMYLNDEEMALKERRIEVWEISVESYREGASGANGGKSGGGCGCN